MDERGVLTAVGRATPSPLGTARVTGAGRFPPDYTAPGMLHAAVLRSEVPHARIESIDLARASAIEGVVAVVTREDLGMDGIVRHQGDVVAAVAAESQDIARAAIREIGVTFDRLPVLDDVETALASDVRLAPDEPTNVTLELEHETGHTLSALSEADVVYEATYRTGRPTHCNLSRRTCIARVDDEGILELMTSVDAPFFARSELSRWLRLPEERIRIVLPELLTSSFGGRSGVNRQCEPIACRLALETLGRPVRLAHEPEEEFVAGTTRHPLEARLTAGADADGRLIALDIDIVADHGPYPDFVSRIVLSASRDRPLDIYALENYRFRGRSVLTNNIPSGEMRGIGATQICHLLGVHMNEMARRVELDPVEFHERNLCDAARTSLSECLRRGREAFGWGAGPGRPGSGVGVAVGCHTTGLGTFHGPDRATASLTLDESGDVTVLVGAPDSGQGSATIWAQIVAEELSIPIDRVTLAPIDTASAPADQWGSIASRSTYVVGSAVKLAAERLAAQLRDRTGDLEAGNRSATPFRIVAEAVTYDTPPTYGAYFAEVGVDLDTGVVKVERFAAALDVGFAVNPAQCRGQIEGAIALGLEFALGAEVVVRHAIPENPNLVDYKVARSTDMPEIETILVESAEQSGPYGARGIGTPALTPVLPAIANAVRDAVGVSLDTVPMHPEDVLSRVLEARRSGSEDVLEPEDRREHGGHRPE